MNDFVPVWLKNIFYTTALLSTLNSCMREQDEFDRMPQVDIPKSTKTDLFTSMSDMVIVTETTFMFQSLYQLDSLLLTTQDMGNTISDNSRKLADATGLPDSL